MTQCRGEGQTLASPRVVLGVEESSDYPSCDLTQPLLQLNLVWCSVHLSACFWLCLFGRVHTDLDLYLELPPTGLKGSCSPLCVLQREVI